MRRRGRRGMPLLRLLLAWSLSVTAMLPVQAQSLKTDLKELREWQAGAVVSQEAVTRYGLGKCFSAQPIPDKVFARMRGKSFPKDCRVPRSSLRYVRILHYDVDGLVRLGEMVCHKDIAADLVEIFSELYRHHYPIHSVRLIDDFEANDEQSMRANNSSCFCFRVIKGQKRLSKHAQGLAVDINTLYNPCVRRMGGKLSVQPSTAVKYADRSQNFPYKIDRNDLLHRLFIAHGFRWGGAWRSVKDYQHFEK